METIYGRHVVETALKQGYPIEKIIVVKSNQAKYKSITRLAQLAGIPIEYVHQDNRQLPASTVHQGIAATNNAHIDHGHDERRCPLSRHFVELQALLVPAVRTVAMALRIQAVRMCKDSRDLSVIATFFHRVEGAGDRAAAAAAAHCLDEEFNSPARIAGRGNRMFLNKLHAEI